MVSFELSKEIKKDVFCFVNSMGQRKVPMRNWASDLRILKVWGSIAHGDSEFFFVPRSWQNKKHLSLKITFVHLCFDHQKKCYMYIFAEKRLEVDIISIIFHNYLSMNPC